MKQTKFCLLCVIWCRQLTLKQIRYIPRKNTTTVQLNSQTGSQSLTKQLRDLTLIGSCPCLYRIWDAQRQRFISPLELSSRRKIMTKVVITAHFQILHITPPPPPHSLPQMARRAPTCLWSGTTARTAPGLCKCAFHWRHGTSPAPPPGLRSNFWRSSQLHLTQTQALTLVSFKKKSGRFMNNFHLN